MEIKIKNLSKYYYSGGKTIKALDNVSLSIPANRIFTLLGPSGCGKTTLLRCIVGLEVDEARCQETVERNLALATALAPVIGYDRAAEISKEAHRTGRTVREVALEWAVLPPEELEAALEPFRMTEPMDRRKVDAL